METPTWELRQGDGLPLLRQVESGTVDALVTDPPAGISMLGADWDSPRGGRAAWISWLAEILRECLRVLKPGANALVWALPRTSHWTMTAIEDAGFEIQDVITHLGAQGMPKAKMALSPSAEYWVLARAPGAPNTLGIEECRTNGRWPKNAVLSHHEDDCAETCAPQCAVALLDAQAGVRKSGAMKTGTIRARAASYSGNWGGMAGPHPGQLRRCEPLL